MAATSTALTQRTSEALERFIESGRMPVISIRRPSHGDFWIATERFSDGFCRITREWAAPNLKAMLRLLEENGVAL